MTDNIMFELMSDYVDEIIGECHITCTEALNVATEALEIYELESITNIASNYGVLMEDDFQYPAATKKNEDAKDSSSSSGSQQSSEKQKKTTKKFFERIVELLKAAGRKIAEIGKKIWEKLKELWAFLKKKFKQLSTSKLFGGKPWPNGYDINFKTGFDSISELQHACRSVGNEMIDKFVGFGNAIKTGDREKMMNFAKNNQAFVVGFYKHPRELINEQLSGPKFDDKDDSVNAWIREVFKYDQKDSDFRMDVAFQSRMVKQVMDVQGPLTTILDVGQRQTNDSMTMLRKAADKVDQLARDAETKTIYPTMGSVLRGFASMMVSTAEFGLVTTGQSVKFACNKYNQLVDHFVSLKLLRKAG